MAGFARQAVSFLSRRSWSWNLGPPRDDLICSVIVHASLEAGQAGLSLAWHADSDSREYRLMVGPLFVTVIGPPPARLKGREEADVPCLLVDRLVAGRRMTGYVHWRHVGASVEWCRLRSGRVVHVKAGPLGFAVEPL